MKGHTKSRSGCTACKAKRLKCDETKPSCSHCQRRGILCPGYRKVLKWSVKYENHGNGVATGPPNFGCLISAASHSIPVSQGNGVTEDQTALKILGPVPKVPTDKKKGSHVPGSGSVDKENETPHPALTAYAASSHHGPGQIHHLSRPSSYLVEIWFKSVCGIWAAFDSPNNPFRRLGSSLWASSEPLYYSLQTMSAAWLTDTQSDDIRQIAVSVPQLATRAIISDLNLFFNDSSKITTIPAALLMSLFCMSSSLNWIDHRQLGLQYLVQARAVISVLDMRSWALSDDDRGLLAFFKHCLTYEEAVRSVVTSNHEAVHTDAIKPSSDILPLTDLTLHPWTGVPPKIISLLGKAMKVCRESRELWRNNTIATLEVMRQATVHICRGQDLEEMLLSVEVPSVSKEKDDSDFNIECHLYYATESFRLCSLLQLYLTFPDLVSRRLPQYVSADGLVPKARWLTPLALHITGLLLKIPHDSSMRCLQPLLCLCIGTGLRCDIGEDPESNNRFEPIYPASHMDAIGVAEENGVSSAPLPLDVRLARKFIVSRLEKLERGLPAKPIVILQKLLRAVWSSYDHETSGGAPHWIDIMTSLNYESVFG